MYFLIVLVDSNMFYDLLDFFLSKNTVTLRYIVCKKKYRDCVLIRNHRTSVDKIISFQNLCKEIASYREKNNLYLYVLIIK